MRKLLLLILLLAALLAVFLALGGGSWRASGLDPQADLPESPAQPPAATDAAPAPTVERAQAKDPAEAETPAQAPGTEPAAAGPQLLVRVVREDGAPLTEPTVVLLESTRGGADLAEPEREAYRIANLDERLDRWGRSFACDADGRAAIPVPPGDWFPLGARAGELWGRSDVQVAALPPGQEVVVLLRRSLHVPVLVVDEAGTPVPDAPIAYRVTRRDGSVVDLEHARTDASGRATLRHLDDSLARVGVGAPRHSAALAWPFAPEVRVDFDPLAPPADPLRLIQPACGALEIEVRGSDGLPREGIAVALQVRPPGGTPAPPAATMTLQATLGLTWARTAQGVARFERVGLGLELEYGADFGSGALQSSHGFGPQRPGETARLRLREPEDSQALTGRILDADGAPLASARLNAELFPADSDRRLQVVRLTTGADGRFRAPWSGDNLPAGPVFLLAQESEPGRLRFLASGFQLPLPASGLDLGDLAFGAPVAARGQVLGPNDEPRGDAQVSLAASAPGPFGKAPRSPFAQLRVSCDDAGRFAILGPLPAGRWLAMAQLASDRDLRCPPQEFAAGATDLLLRFSRTPGVYGRVLADPWLPLDTLSIMLENADGGSGSSPDASGAIRLPIHRSGMMDFVVRARVSEAELWRRNGLVLAADTVLDLGEIDLRGRLQISRLTLRDAQGAIIPRATLWVEARDRAGARPAFCALPLTLARTEPLRCWIEAQGCALREVIVDRPEMEISLSAGIPVRLACASVPAGGRWRVRLLRAPDAGGAPIPCQSVSPTAEGSTAVSLILPSDGAWTALLEIADPGDDAYRTRPEALGAPPPVLRVLPGTAEQRFELTAAAGAFP